MVDGYVYGLPVAGTVAADDPESVLASTGGDGEGSDGRSRG